jgi:AcrR family transcriptional regulator
MNEEKFNKRRLEIMEASFEVFSKKGYQNTKISDITKKINMGHGTFYRYFKNKADIFIYVFDEMLSEFQGILEIEPLDKANDLQSCFDQFARIAWMVIEIYSKYIVAARVYYYEVLGSDQVINKKNDEAVKIFCKFSEIYFQNGVDKGFFRSDIDIQVVSSILQGALVSGVKEGLVASPKEAYKLADRWATTIISLLQKGIAI